MKCSLLALAAIAACATDPVHTTQLRIQPTRPLVAHRIVRPLYVVLDPAQVPDHYTIPPGSVKEIQIFEIREFVRRDLRAALTAVFEQVDIVEPTDAQLPVGTLTATVQIQRFGAVPDQTGSNAMRVTTQMGWSFAIAVKGQREFLFSSTETVTGGFAMTTVTQTPEGLQSTYQLALEHLLAKLADPAVLARLEPPPVPPS